MRRALVTGAARGIGAAITARLRAEGTEVVTLDREEGCDHTIDLAVDPLPDFGDVDVCVSNAAITDTIAPAHRMTPEQCDRAEEIARSENRDCILRCDCERAVKESK